MPAFIDLTGQTFFRLTVTGPAESRQRPNGTWVRYWKCQCICGNFIEAKTGHLRPGRIGKRAWTIQSCGCWRDESRFLRGTRKTKLPEYNVLAGMIERCTNPNHPAWSDYGGRGIYVCDEWMNDFWCFYHEMGPRPNAAYTIERLNNNGPYMVDNCCWATRAEQCRNNRQNRLVTFQDKTFCIAEWSRRTNIHAATIINRLNSNWDITRALTEPPRQRQKL